MLLEAALKLGEAGMLLPGCPKVMQTVFWPSFVLSETCPQKGLLSSTRTCTQTRQTRTLRLQVASSQPVHSCAPTADFAGSFSESQTLGRTCVFR